MHMHVYVAEYCQNEAEVQLQAHNTQVPKNCELLTYLTVKLKKKITLQ